MIHLCWLDCSSLVVVFLGQHLKFRLHVVFLILGLGCHVAPGYVGLDCLLQVMQVLLFVLQNLLVCCRFLWEFFGLLIQLLDCQDPEFAGFATHFFVPIFGSRFLGFAGEQISWVMILLLLLLLQILTLDS